MNINRKYEYDYISIPSIDKFIQVLNSRGLDGWRLIYSERRNPPGLLSDYLYIGILEREINSELAKQELIAQCNRDTQTFRERLLGKRRED